MRGNIEASQDLFPGADMPAQQWAKEMDNRVKRQAVASVTTAADDTEPVDEPMQVAVDYVKSKAPAHWYTQSGETHM